MNERGATPLGVLGTLEIARDGERVQLGSAQQRRLLAVLLVHANEVVSSDRLIDILWGDHLRPSAMHTLRTLVSRMRATLGDDRLETCPPGYRLRVATGELDALRFEELVRNGLESSAQPEVALGEFDAALALWRGLPYTEFTSEEFATAEVARLVDLHASAIEERAAALLDLSRPQEVIGELEAEIAAQPFRERLRALLMLALARAGRPVESLRAYDGFRRFLADEIGVVPSPALQELNDDIVRQHPDVSWTRSPTNAATAGLPSGTVTFLFTDVEGSTRLWDEYPDVMHNTMARHDEILRDAVESHDGHVVNSTGDGLHAVFVTAHDAVTAAVAAQTALLTDEWEITATVRVRMGIHTGEAEVRDGHYSGSVVNRAARLMSVAHGGQIVVSSATQELLRDAPPEKYGFVDLGQHRLRDLGRPERLFQVLHPDLGREFPALRALGALAGNLPLPASSFVGREVERVRIADALAGSRVVTLTGMGGIGKTRLALRVADEVLSRFRDGAWLCELASVRDPDGVLDAVAGVLRVTARPGLSLEDSLLAYLRDQELLLVLDNCEHVLPEVAGLVAAIEATCAGVRVLATSREGLNIGEEQILVVPPMRLPDDHVGSALADESDAVRLFAERARAVKADFAVDDSNRGDVVAVCRRLDGLALAIELAAARIPAMNPSEIARRLDLRFLTRGGRVATERHQTLRAAIDWSYDLLTEPEQRLLGRLAVFSGGCTLEAAEAVCAGDPIDCDLVLELVASLVARSLVDAVDGPETRYRLLEPIRQYAEERRAEAGETARLRRRHAEYYIEFAGAARSHMGGSGQIEWGARFAREHDNLHAAMAHALDTQNVDLAFGLFCQLPSQYAQVHDLVVFDPAALLALPGAAEHPGAAVALLAVASDAADRGDGDLALRLCDEALAAEERLGPVPGAHLGIMASAVRSGAAGGFALDEMVAHSLEGARRAEAEDLPGIASFFYSVAAQFGSWIDPVAARQHATQGLAIARQIAMPGAIVLNLSILAGALAADDPEQGRALLFEARELASTLGYENPTELLLAVTAAARLGEWPTALGLATRLLHHQSRSGFLRPNHLGWVMDFSARGLAEHQPEVAAMLQGASSTIFPSPPFNEGLVGESGRASNIYNVIAFLGKVRDETMRLLIAALGELRVEVLRAQGAAMEEVQACRCACTHINEYLANAGEAVG